MTIPNLGVTQVIQQQSPLGIASQGLGQLGQLMVQMEQAREERRKNEVNAAYMQAQTDAAKRKEDRDIAEAARLLANEREVGTAIRDYMTPVEQTMDVPLLGMQGLLAPTGGGQITGKRERALPEVLKGKSAEVVESIVGKLGGMEQTRQQKREEKVARAQFMSALPSSVREKFAPVFTLAMLGSKAKLDQNVMTMVLRPVLDDVSTDKAALAALRKEFPQLRNLPDDELVEQAAGVAGLKAKLDMGLIRDPNKASPDAILAATTRGGTTTAKTADELRADMRVLGGMIDDQRARLATLSKIPTEFTAGTTGILLPKMPPDKQRRYEAWQKSVQLEQAKLDRLNADQTGLYDQLRQVTSGGTAAPVGGAGVVPPPLQTPPPSGPPTSAEDVRQRAALARTNIMYFAEGLTPEQRQAKLDEITAIEQRELQRFAMQNAQRNLRASTDSPRAPGTM